MVPAIVFGRPQLGRGPESDLANTHTRIYSHRLNYRQFQCPSRTASQVAEISGDIKEDTEAANRRFSQKRNNILLTADHLSRCSEVQFVRKEDNPRGSDGLGLPSARSVFSDQDSVVEVKIVAVRVYMLFAKWLDADRTSTPLFANSNTG